MRAPNPCTWAWGLLQAPQAEGRRQFSNGETKAQRFQVVWSQANSQCVYGESRALCLSLSLSSRSLPPSCPLSCLPFYNKRSNMYLQYNQNYFISQNKNI